MVIPFSREDPSSTQYNNTILGIIILSYACISGSSEFHVTKSVAGGQRTILNISHNHGTVIPT